jgi:hypothetical protein
MDQVRAQLSSALSCEVKFDNEKVTVSKSCSNYAQFINMVKFQPGTDDVRSFYLDYNNEVVLFTLLVQCTDYVDGQAIAYCNYEMRKL